MSLGTGHSSTLAWAGNQGYVVAHRTISLHEQQGESADISHLNSIESRKYVPPDLYGCSPMEVEIVHDSELTPLPLSFKDQLVLTLPLHEGEDTAANYTGNAWVSRRKHPDLASNQERIERWSIQWEEAPTFTPAVPTPEQ